MGLSLALVSRIKINLTSLLTGAKLKRKKVGYVSLVARYWQKFEATSFRTFYLTSVIGSDSSNYGIYQKRTKRDY